MCALSPASDMPFYPGYWDMRWPVERRQRGSTELHGAVRRRDLDGVKELLARGADVHAESDVHADGCPVLLLAVARGDLDIVAALLEKGADVNVKGYHDDHLTSRCTALHVAAERCHLDMMKLLLKKGANVHARGDTGYTVLECAAMSREYCGTGRLEVVELLLKNGVDMNAQSPTTRRLWSNDCGNTALHYAVMHSRKEMAYFLLEHGAVAVIENYRRLTPLDYAIIPLDRSLNRNGEPDVELICRMLLPSGALVRLAKDVVEAHEKRQKRIEACLKRAEQSPGFLTDLAGALAGIEAPDCARGTGTVLAALVRKMDAFAKSAGNGTGAQEANQAPKRVRRE